MSGDQIELGNDLVALEHQLLTATKAGDQPAQMRLYRLGGEHHLKMGDVDQGCFYLTNAWVLSLATGDPCEQELRQLLAQHGRV